MRQSAASAARLSNKTGFGPNRMYRKGVHFVGTEPHVLMRQSLVVASAARLSNKTGFGPNRMYRKGLHFVGTEPHVLKYHLLLDKKPCESRSRLVFVWLQRKLGQGQGLHRRRRGEGGHPRPDERTIRKTHMIDDHVMLAFAGLSADARVLVDKARIECQRCKLTLEDPVTISYISRFIANTKQRFTQSPGRRSFGISMFISGFDYDGTPRLFKTEPSGAYYEYLANSAGRGEKTVREYLEEHYAEDTVKDEASALLLVIKALSQVVQSGAANIEIAVMTRGDKVEEERLATEAEETAKKERN